MYNIINSTIPCILCNILTLILLKIPLTFALVSTFCILLREDHQPRNAEKYGDTEKHRSKLIKKQIYLDIWFFK